MTVTDYFSKRPEGAPLKDKIAVGVADFLFTVFGRHGWPNIIISGRNTIRRSLINIERAQQRQKAQYNAKRGTHHVWIIMVLCVYIFKSFKILHTDLALVRWLC